MKKTTTKKEERRATRGQERTAKVGWKLANLSLETELLDVVMLHGPAGTGKTYAGYTHGRVGRGVYALTLTDETPASELRGTFVPKGDTFVWQNGPVTKALLEGARLVLNEPSHASTDVIAFLYAILESPATARITLPTNETIRPAPGFNVVLCDNQSPENLPSALADRIQATLHITEPHPNALAKLSPPIREAALRSFALEEDRRVSLRGWLTLDRIREEFGLEDACLVAFGAERGSQICDALRMGGM